MGATCKPRYWAGDGWVTQEKIDLPGGLTVEKLAAFCARHGVPPEAEFAAEVAYDEDGPVVMLTWLVPEED